MSLHKLYREHPSFCHEESFTLLCAPLKALNITHFSHVRVTEKGKFSFLSQNPVFLRHYLESGYYNFDAHRIIPETKEQYMLRDLQKLSGMTKQMHADFNAYGYGHTFTLIRRGISFIDVYNFATTLGNQNINEEYLQNIDQLKQFILYFHDQISVHASLAKAYEFNLSLKQNNAGFQLENPKLVPTTSQTMSLKSLNKIHLPGTQTYLTRREYECLSWLARGKTQEQIADILEITLRTVKAHIINVREKLQCANQFQLGMLFNQLENIIL